MSEAPVQPPGAPVEAYVGIGANLDEPIVQLENALAALAELPQTRLASHSAFYRNPPMGPPDQPDYVNAVACLKTSLAPENLLDCLLSIETGHGRVRDGTRWGPRRLDLDLLVYGALQHSSDRLTVPHPGIADRVFVVHPLHEIAPRLDIPGVGPVAHLQSSLDSSELVLVHPASE